MDLLHSTSTISTDMKLSGTGYFHIFSATVGVHIDYIPILEDFPLFLIHIGLVYADNHHHMFDYTVNKCYINSEK